MATLKKTTEKTTDGPKMMPGSQDGHYFPFARKGNVLLGVRLSAIKDGMYYGVGGTTYFAARLRSAPENGLFADEDAKQKVVKLQANPPNLWDAWPGVVMGEEELGAGLDHRRHFRQGPVQGRRRRRPHHLARRDRRGQAGQQADRVPVLDRPGVHHLPPEGS